MKINGKHTTAIWVNPSNKDIIQIIDQRWLPHKLIIENLNSVNEVATCIKDMHVRGAPLIGATGAFGMYLAVIEAQKSNNFLYHLEQSKNILLSTRPTAIDLSWGVNRIFDYIKNNIENGHLKEIVLNETQKVKDEIIENCHKIGINGLEIILSIHEKNKDKVINILTHCNAGWLATVDHGTATAPIYAAHDAGIKVHVWVDETRPRNQGARLTAWELQQHGVPCTIISDNVGGHLMQSGRVDIVITGSDRTTYTGDVANKIGTYLKALAAYDNDIPFYVALPESTFDWTIRDGLKQIPIEERSAHEVHHIQGKINGKIKEIKITPEDSHAVNYAFDVTPSRLVTGLITERGICQANEKSILKMYPEKANLT